jgi:prevent-host-death family protein
MRSVSAGEFKAKCLAIMDEVNETGEPVLITKRGKPVARVVPAEMPEPHKTNVESIFRAFHGLVRINGDPNDLVDPIIPAEEWDHLKDDWSIFPPE